MENIEPEYMEFCKYQQPIAQSWQHFSFSTAHISFLGSSTSLCLIDERRTKQKSKTLKLVSATQLLWKMIFWFSMRCLKDLWPGMSSMMSTCITGLRRNSVSGLNLPTASWTSLCYMPAMVTHLSLGNNVSSVMGLLCFWQTQSYRSAALSSQPCVQRPVMVSSEAGTPLSDGFGLLASILPPF